MKEPTMEEVLKCVSFMRDIDGKLQVLNVNGIVYGDVWGEVRGKVLNSLH